MSTGTAVGVPGFNPSSQSLMARTWQQRPVSDARQQTTVALMDAAERLLYEVGYAGVTTRAVAEEAGVRPGLVHYYFGSMEELLIQTLERFVDQLATAVDDLYADPSLSFADKWRLGSQFWVEEPTSHFPKVLMELLAVGWNLPTLKTRLTNVHARFRAVFEHHFGQALRHYGLDENQYPLKVIVAAVTTFQLGLIVEGLSDVHEGHQELLGWIQRWIDDLETQAADRSVVPDANRPAPSPARRRRRGRGTADKGPKLGA